MQAVNLSSLKNIKTITLPIGFSISSGSVYFSGNGFPTPMVSSIISPNFAGLEYLSGKCQTGSVITFDVVLEDNNKKTYRGSGGCIITNFQKKDLPVLTVDTTIIEAIETLSNRFTRGTIYFAGAGFPVAESIKATEINTSKGNNMISRLRPISSITFDNCNYFDKEKKLVVTINKTIKLK